jgi:hypothetical protein
MKKRVIIKKLILNKETVSNLSAGQMGDAYGGADEITTTGVPCLISCYSCKFTYCTCPIPGCV